LRITSLPAAGGSSALTARRCGSGKLRSTSGKKIKNRVNFFMEAPLRMRESYNIPDWKRKKWGRRPFGTFFIQSD
jgi:hypothetical protein